LSFTHEFVRGEGGDAATLLLLHGTGGNERDILALGKAIAPAAALLAPRGKVLEGAAPRFFRRIAEGVFDQEDLRFRTSELADFVEDAVRSYGIDRHRLIAVGYSNGANIASSVLLRFPHVLAGAILFRPMVPLEPEAVPDLGRVHVLISSGRGDPIVPAGEPELLAEMLERAGASVAVHWHSGGHELGEDDLEAARMWLATQMRFESPAGGPAGE